jgi:molybdate transport system regulatory protein
MSSTQHRHLTCAYTWLPGCSCSAAADLRVMRASSMTGRAVRISRGATGNEVFLQLDAGLQLVGFSAPASGIKVNALIDESAVAIALPA